MKVLVLRKQPYARVYTLTWPGRTDLAANSADFSKSVFDF